MRVEGEVACTQQVQEEDTAVPSPTRTITAATTRSTCGSGKIPIEYARFHRVGHLHVLRVLLLLLLRLLLLRLRWRLRCTSPKFDGAFFFGAMDFESLRSENRLHKGSALPSVSSRRARGPLARVRV